LNILMLRHSAGYEHSYLPDAEVALKEIGKREGWKVQTTANCDRINPKTMENLDVLIFATSGELPIDDEQKRLVIDFVRGGKGFVGIHNATATGYAWPEYGEMIGGYFNGHPWTQEVNVIVEDTDHPATRMLGRSFKMYEEVYTHRNWDRSKTHVLYRLDIDTVDLSKGSRDDHDYALAWCHEFGEGRVIYTGLGHFDAQWHEPWFLNHITECVRWAAGR